jgi:hypothetical protein
VGGAVPVWLGTLIYFVIGSVLPVLILIKARRSGATAVFTTFGGTAVPCIAAGIYGFGILYTMMKIFGVPP